MAAETIDPKNISSTANLFNNELSKNQKNLRDFNRKNNAAPSDVSKSINKVSESVVNLSKKTQNLVVKSFDKIASMAKSTANASKSIAESFSNSITKDMNINKQNLMAMSLAKSTPIFGYYVSKFMETDLFRNLADRIKNVLGNAVSWVGEKFKAGISGLFGGAKSLFGKVKDVISNKDKSPSISKTSSTDESSTVSIRELKNKGLEIPAMAKGGAVKEGGLAEVHAAEVVAPINKILKSMERVAKPTKEETSVLKKSVKKTTELNKQFGNVIKSTINRVDMVEKKSLEEMNFLKTFYKNIREEFFKRKNQTREDKIFRAILDIRNSLYTKKEGIISALSNAWRRTLFEHPGLKALINISKALTGFAFRIVRGLFVTRGNYESHIIRYARGSPLERTAAIMSLMYPGVMYRLDQLHEDLTGEKRKKGWSIFGTLMMKPIKSAFRTTKEAISESIKSFKESRDLGHSKTRSIMQSSVKGIEAGFNQALEETGIKKLGEVSKNILQLTTKEGREKRRERLEQKRLEQKKEKEKGRFGPTPELLRNLNERVEPIQTFYANNAKLMEESLGANKKITEQNNQIIDMEKVDGKYRAKMLEYNKAQTKASESTASSLRFQRMMRFVSMIGGIVGTAISTLGGFLGKVLGIGKGVLGGILGGSLLKKGGGALLKGGGALTSTLTGGMGISGLLGSSMGTIGGAGAGAMIGATGAVGGAGAAGYGIGTLINNFISKKTGSKSWLFDYLLGDPTNKKDGGLVGAITGAVKNIGIKIKDTFMSGVYMIRDTFFAIVDKIKNVSLAIKDKGVEIASDIYNSVKNTIKRIKNSIGGFFGDIFGKVKNLFGIDSDENGKPKGKTPTDKARQEKDKASQTGVVGGLGLGNIQNRTNDKNITENQVRDKMDEKFIVRSKINDSLANSKEFQKMSEESQNKFAESLNESLKEVLSGMGNVSSGLIQTINNNLTQLIQNSQGGGGGGEVTNQDLLKIYKGDMS